MVVELQMMVDTVVDSSCYQQDISTNLSLGDMLAVINKREQPLHHTYCSGKSSPILTELSPSSVKQ
jgi:hypothetical protein